MLSRFHLGRVWVLGCSVVSASFQPHALQPRASHMVLVLKNPPANAEDMKDTSSIPEWGRSPGGGHSSVLVWRISMDRGAWPATVHGVAKSRTRLKRLSTHAQTVACQAPLSMGFFFLSMGFSRQEYWSELPLPSPGDLPNPGIKLCLCIGRQILYHCAAN